MFVASPNGAASTPIPTERQPRHAGGGREQGGRSLARAGVAGLARQGLGDKATFGTGVASWVEVTSLRRGTGFGLTAQMIEWPFMMPITSPPPDSTFNSCSL